MTDGSQTRSEYRRSIRFVLDGETIELRDVDPNRTLLEFLREDLRRTGTKEGCAEGDCGACTVVVAEVNPADDRLRARAINSCICFLPTLDGKELLTVESLASGDLHPVQQSMVDCHGSQCGFCTPGFVMSLFALYKSHSNPTRRDIDDALAGNLCRCTGYSPIIIAAVEMYASASSTDDWLRLPAGLPAGKDEAQRIQRLKSLESDRSLCIEWEDRKYFAPGNVDELADLIEVYADATILAGGTDVGLQVTKQLRELNTIVYAGNVRELGIASVTDTHLEIGAGVTLTDAMELVAGQYPTLEELFLRFASPPIRNAGTLGGNIANGSPIGDSMPALLALDTELVLQKSRSTRVLSLNDFYVAYQQTALQPGEFVERILIPLPVPDSSLQSYKVSKRFDQDISAVCGAFRIRLDGDKVVEVRVAYGGMAEVPARASGCEKAILQSGWNDASIEAAMNALDEDFAPITDMRSSGDYRRLVCRNLLKRFYLETTGAASERVYAYGR